MGARWSRVGALACLAACGESATGGVTARLVFDDGLAPGRGALRLAAPPAEVEKLVIEALAKDGTVLGVTVLAKTPDPTFSELPLDPAGGRWRIDRVRAGKERMLRARAFLGVIGSPMDDRALVFEGELTGIEVRPSAVTDAGALTLRRVRTVRVPALDLDPPIPPAPVTLEAVPSGEALIVRFPRTPDADLAGHIVAYTTRPLLTATVARGRDLSEASEIVPGLIIAARLGPDELTTILTGLADRTPTRVLVYAFDGDAMGLPLNYSIPTEALGVPADVVPPAIPQSLTVTSSGADQVRIDFVAPGEDDEEGNVARFEVRAATTAADLLDGARFATSAFIVPPPPSVPGALARTFASRSALGFAGRFWVGVRAVDASGNAGDVSVAEAREVQRVPMIARLEPELALTGGAIEIVGSGFGDRAGAVSLTASTATSSFTRRLSVASWTDRSVRAVIPEDARSGGLVLRRSDGARASRALAVVARAAQRLEPGPPPIAFAGIPDRRASVLLSQVPEGRSAAQAMITRLSGERLIEMGLAAESGEERLLASALAWSREAGVFAAIWSRELDETASVAIVPTSTAAPVVRVPEAIAFGGIDSLALELLEPRAGRLPALLAFTIDGRVRTTTVADLRTEPFFRFAVVNTSTAPCSDVALRRRPNRLSPDLSQIVLAYREADALVVMTGRGTGGGARAFTELPAPVKPPMRGKVEILDVTGTGFVLAYESPEGPALLALGDYGRGPGLTVFARGEPGERLRFEDVGMIRAAEGIRIAVLASRVRGSTAELIYTEVPVARLAASGAYGAGGLSLDLAPAGSSGKLACKPEPRPECPIAWLGDGAPSLLFNRR